MLVKCLEHGRVESDHETFISMKEKQSGNLLLNKLLVNHFITDQRKNDVERCWTLRSMKTRPKLI